GTQGARRRGQTAWPRAMGRSHRYRWVDHTGQCAVDDPLWWRGGRLRIGRWDGSSGDGRPIHSARGVPHRRGFREVSAGTAAGGVEAIGVRYGRRQTRRDDQRDRSVGGDGSRSAHRRRRDPRSNRGQNRVEPVNAWASGPPGANVTPTAPTPDPNCVLAAVKEEKKN